MPRKHSWRVRIRAEWRKGEECIWREGIGAEHCATDPSAISGPIQQLTPDFGCPPLADEGANGPENERRAAWRNLKHTCRTAENGRGDPTGMAKPDPFIRVSGAATIASGRWENSTGKSVK